ncbi:helix-turn-helix domain-containing protein [Streptomyces sp. 4N509B]|uniref:helix-turn-helix domain-containing protein n=1 Tax=Streptomyces sp. 4N509B TaxID=3457413 RepID=UPI003FD28E4A
MSNGRPENEQDGEQPLDPREFFGEVLGERRREAGLSQSQLAERVICSPSLIAHFEAGRRKPKREDAMRIDEALGAGSFFAKLRRTLLQLPYAPHFNEAAELEREAIAIHEFDLALVPGILQTAAYARAVFQAFEANPVTEEVDEKVVNRLARREILKDPRTPLVWAVLDEGVIRRAVGGPAVMAEQLRHLAALGRSGRVLTQVIPFSAGAHALQGSMMKLMRFADQPPVAYVEGIHTGTLLDDPALVRSCQQAYALASAVALSPEASLTLVETVAEEFDRHDGASLSP